jgi:hypothetical protein
VTHAIDPADIRVILDVPLHFRGADGTPVHTPMVEATVADVDTLLILDTGSTDHVLTRELLGRVGVVGTPAEDGTDHAGAPVPSWSVGDLEVRISGVPLALRDVVAIDGPPPFAGWGIGGSLSPQHLHPTARVLIDLIGDRLVIAEGVGDVDASLMAGVPSLRPLRLDRAQDTTTVAVTAAVEPFPPVTTMLDTGGRATEFARSSVPGLAGGVEREAGAGVSGAPVIGADAGAQVLLVGGARIPIPNLVVRDRMDGPSGLVGIDVLRGTALIVGADTAAPIVWLVPTGRDDG